VGRLIYSMIASLDGYVADRHGDFAWAVPDEEVHTFVNDREGSVGTYLYGRRMYETMRYWATAHELEGLTDYERDYTAIWQAADKVVYSTTLEAGLGDRTRVERAFDPEAVRALKAAAERDLSVAGPGLAARAIRAGLVDECHVYLAPVVVGTGRPLFPGGVRARLELLDERRFGNGMVWLRYRLP